MLQNKLNFHHNVPFRINPDTRNRFGSVIPEVSIPGVRVAPGLQIRRVVRGATANNFWCMKMTAARLAVINL